MRNAQVILLALSLLVSLNANANWRLMAERAGFYGEFSFGFSYEWQPEHAFDYLLGVYEIDHESFFQSNMSYRYTRWAVPFKGHEWRPVQFGFFLVYAMNQERYFLRSPGKYPYPGYYDETALRYGLEFATSMTFKPSNIGVGFHIRVFDNGLIAAFNNRNRHLQYYTSSGMSLQYAF